MAEQQQIFKDDADDPQIARTADRFVELGGEFKVIKEKLAVQKASLIGLMKKAKRTILHHRGKTIKWKHTPEKDDLSVSDQKPPKKRGKRGRS